MVALDTVSKPTYLLVGEANPSGLVFLWVKSKIWAVLSCIIVGSQGVPISLCLDYVRMTNAWPFYIMHLIQNTVTPL